MAVTVKRFLRCEIWTDLQAAGGSRVAVLGDRTALTAHERVDGADVLTIALPLNSPKLAEVRSRRVLRVVQDDAAFDEWRITGISRQTSQGSVEITAQPALFELAERNELVSQANSAGNITYVFESVGLSPTIQIQTFVLPVLPAWVVLGTIDPTVAIDMAFDADTALSGLRQIAEKTGTELQLRRVGTTQYAIDLIPAIGAAALVADFRPGKNLADLRQEQSTIEQFMRAYPFGAGEEGANTMARAVWQVTAIAGSVVTLADPAGGDGPILFDDQLNGKYLRTSAGVLTQVLDSTAATQTVLVASVAGIAVNDLVQFRLNAAGKDLTYLDSPPDIALYGPGVKVGVVAAPDVPATNNLVQNPAFRSWPGAANALPSGWQLVGTPTIAKTETAPFWRSAGRSARVTTAAAGHGIQTVARPVQPNALEPFASGFMDIWVVSGQVRVELVIVSVATGLTTVLPVSPQAATNSFLGDWASLGVTGIDLNALQASTIALRILQNGTAPADFYVDAGQITQSAAQQPFVDGSGGTILWQRANDALRVSGGPITRYDLELADLARLDPDRWGFDSEVTLGGTVRVTEPAAGIAITTRVMEVVRDYLVPAATRVVLSSKPDDLTGTLSRPKRGVRTTPTVSDVPGLVYAEAFARIVSSSATQVTVEVTSLPAGTQVQLVGVTGSAALASGPAAGVPSPSGTQWVFNRGAINAGVGQAQFRASGTGLQSDDDFVSIEEQGRDTVPLIARARVTASTPTQVTVRVAVADPYPQGASSVSIAYQQLGTGGVSPISPQNAFTPTADIDTSGYIEFTVTRPAFGAGAGRVTFTATAAGRTSDSDAVDVPEQDRDTVPLAVRAKVQSTSATQVVIRVAVADPYPQGAGSVAIGYTADGVSGAVSPISPQTLTPTASLDTTGYIDFTVPRPAFGSGTGRVTFTATANGRVAGVDAVDVPAIERDTVYAEAQAKITAVDATSVTIEVVGLPSGAAVQLVGVTGSTARTAGPLPGVVSASGTVWTFSRGAFQAGAGQAQFRATLTGYVNDDDFVEIPEQGRDTVALAMRAKVLSTTATQVVARVAVADPYPQGAGSASIAYTADGIAGAVSPISPQTLTPTASIDTTAYVDFTIPRPAFGAGTGRVTFTGTAAGRTSDSDALDIPAQDIVLPTVKEVTSETDTTGSLEVVVLNDIEGRVTSVDFVTKPGRGATTATSDAVAPFTAAVTLVEKLTSYIEYSVIGKNAAGVTGQVLHQGKVAFIAGDKPAVTGIDLTVKEDGSVTGIFTGESDCESFRYLASTSAVPTDASVEASGTIVGGRQATVTGLATLTLGQRCYVRVIPYSAATAGGRRGESMTGEVDRQNKSTAKTLRVPAAELVPSSHLSNWEFGPGQVIPIGTSQQNFYGSIVLPRGITLTTWRVRVNRVAAASTVSCELFRVNDDGTGTSLGSLIPSSDPMVTLSAVLNETVSDPTYSVHVRLQKDPNAIGPPIFVWLEVDYTSPDLSKSY